MDGARRSREHLQHVSICISMADCKHPVLNMNFQDPTRPSLRDHNVRLSLTTDFDPYDLVSQVGREVAAAMSSALERVNSLTLSGRIDRTGLRALRDEIERARRAGMMGQQVGRLASGRLRLSEEKLDLTAMLREALAQRGREMESRGIEVRQVLNPATVSSDPTLLFSLLQGVLDWCFEHSSSRINLTVEVKPWPAQAHLYCAFEHAQPELVDSRPASLVTASLQTMSWRLIERCAKTLKLTVERHDSSQRTLLSIGFPTTVMSGDAVDAPLDLGLDLDTRSDAGRNSKPLAGSHVLVVSTRREIRAAVRDIVRPMGVMLDFVGSVDEAREFCAGGLPHALVYESALGGGHMQRLLAELSAEAPSLAFIEIGEQGRPFEVMNVMGRERSRVSKDALAEALPKALMFELARSR